MGKAYHNMRYVDNTDTLGIWHAVSILGALWQSSSLGTHSAFSLFRALSVHVSMLYTFL